MSLLSPNIFAWKCRIYDSSQTFGALTELCAQVYATSSAPSFL